MMKKTSGKPPIETLHLFPILDRLLIELLESLTPRQWNQPTIAKLWSVKDIAAHLLDGNLRTLSASRDQHLIQPDQPIYSYSDLVAYLNQLNADWVKAFRRLSPKVITSLLQTTGKEYHEHLTTLDPFGKAIFSVAWAGEQESRNWFHIAREYTEKFIHQQQIRDAVDKPGLLTKQLFYPFINTMMYALPYTYRNIDAPEGSTVQVSISGEIDAEWNIEKVAADWQFSNKKLSVPDSRVIIDPQTAWKLFSKGITPVKARKTVKILGNEDLGQTALQMISVMA